MIDFDNITWMKLEKRERPAKGGIFIARRQVNNPGFWSLGANDGIVPGTIQTIGWSILQFTDVFRIVEHSTDPAHACRNGLIEAKARISTECVRA